MPVAQQSICSATNYDCRLTRCGKEKSTINSSEKFILAFSKSVAIEATRGGIASAHRRRRGPGLGGGEQVERPKKNF